MYKEKPKRVRIHGCYYVEDQDLGIDTGTYGHDVFVIAFSKDKKKVKVKTITSIERKGKENGLRVFKKNKKNNNYVEQIYDGEVVVMSKRDLCTDRLSGVNNNGIWISKKKLYKSKYNLKYPKRYEQIIGK